MNIKHPIFGSWAVIMLTSTQSLNSDVHWERLILTFGSAMIIDIQYHKRSDSFPKSVS